MTAAPLLQDLLPPGRRTSHRVDGYLLPNSEQRANASIRRAISDRREARCLARLSAQPDTVFKPECTTAITRSRPPKMSHIDSTPYAASPQAKCLIAKEQSGPTRHAILWVQIGRL